MKKTRERTSNFLATSSHCNLVVVVVVIEAEESKPKAVELKWSKIMFLLLFGLDVEYNLSIVDRFTCIISGVLKGWGVDLVEAYGSFSTELRDKSKDFFRVP